MKGLL